jgi:hypothetical protein
MLQLLLASQARTDAGEFGIWTGYTIPENRGGWHPLVRRLYDYWLSIARPERLPGRRDLTPEDIAPLWSHVWMVDVSHGPLRYRYRVCGTEVVRSLGREVTGLWFDEVHPEANANPHARDRLRFTAMTGCPTWRRGPPLWNRHPDQRTVETCIVPLADDGRRVNKMIGVAVAYDVTGRPI